MRRLALWTVLILLLSGAGIIVHGYREATTDPIVRVAKIEVVGLDRPFRILFISDPHVQEPDMRPDRLERILRQMNGLRPDLILLGGDFVGNKPLQRKISDEAAIAPFRALRAPYGVLAVLGNHDEAHEVRIRAALERAGVELLQDEVRRRGPVSVAGIQQRPRRTIRRLLELPGPRLLFSHKPDIVTYVPPGIDLTLAGHTHCGQIVVPLLGALATGTDLAERYTCGETDYRGSRLIVTAGLGTSHVPLRLGAPPDVWLVILEPPAATPR